MKMTLRSFELPLRHEFRIARESRTVQGSVVVQLEYDGIRGYGEATENPYYGVTIEGITKLLETARDTIEAADPTQPELLWEKLQAALPDAPFAQCAVDCAVYDLWGKLAGQPVWKLWGLDTATCPVSDYTIGIDSIGVMCAKMDEFPGWPVYKIKLGTKEDIDIVRALREHTDATFRVDANCGWTADETIQNAPILKELGVEFIEQPLPADAWNEMRRVYAESALPIIADESCRVESDVARCEGYFHGVNVKLTKCGGLTPGRRMILDARRRGMKTMVGCMVESSVGIAAIAQLLPMLDYVDMDGAILLGEDIAESVILDKGTVLYQDRPGSGIRLLDSIL